MPSLEARPTQCGKLFLRSFLPSKALLATSSRQAYRSPIDFSHQSALPLPENRLSLGYGP
jgi:hypothetical protein